MKALVVVLVAASFARADDPLLRLPNQDKALGLRITVTVDGHSPEKAHEAFLDRLFDYFDRDADGSLSNAESKRVFALPAAGGRPILPDFVPGKCTRAEFKRLYRAAGFSAVSVVALSSGAELSGANANLFRRLDRDGNGHLSREELKRAPAILRALDADEDEVLTIAELIADPRSSSNNPKDTAQITWAMTAREKPADGELTVDLGKLKRPPELHNVSGQSFKAAADWAGSFAYADGVIQVAELTADPSERLRATREFYLAPFKSALGEKSFLEKKRIEEDSSLAFLDTLFAHADRNGDGRLTSAELEMFLDLIEMGVRAPIVVSIQDEGRSLIALLDENRDGKLDRRELSRAHRLLPTAVESMAIRDIPRRVNVSIAQGLPGRTFGPAMIVGNRPTPIAKKPTNRAGPKWFLAMDKNGDSLLSPQEFLGPPELFATLDTNRDGFISLEEARQGMP